MKKNIKSEVKIGSLIRLKSGGPKMTVTKLYPDINGVDADWFIGGGQLQSGFFIFGTFYKYADSASS